MRTIVWSFYPWLTGRPIAIFDHSLDIALAWYSNLFFFHPSLHWSYIMLIELNPLRLEFCASNLVLFAQRSSRSPLILWPPFWIEWHCRKACTLVSFPRHRESTKVLFVGNNAPFSQIKLDGHICIRGKSNKQC